MIICAICGYFFVGSPCGWVSCKVSLNFYLCVPLGKVMQKKAFSKKLMLGAGILAAIVILCSQAFQQETDSFLSKIKETQTEKPAEAEKIIVATPTDAVTSGQAVQVGDVNPSLIREIIQDEESTSAQPTIDKTILAEFFKTLFRVFISPQAP